MLKDLLDALHDKFNRREFIDNDPIVVPHQFSRKEDIEVAGLFAAVFAWGQRTTIINKSKELLLMMDNAPLDFLLHHQAKDLKPIQQFKHRTFNATDALYFIAFLSALYRNKHNLEDAFIYADVFGMKNKILTEGTTEQYLNNFRKNFFSLNDFPLRTQKHISSPLQKSTCKRLNMYLRWMVRKDKRGVDFGIWKNIKASELVCPVDVHVDRVARSFGLIARKQLDWLAALELTENLRGFDAKDPVKYDFALFGLGLESKGDATHFALSKLS